jgi:hypothetical protein
MMKRKLIYDNPQGIKDIASAVLLRAVDDYCNAKNNFERGQITKDLRSEWTMFLTDGMSTMVASNLKADAKGIKSRLRRELKNAQNSVHN